MEHNTPAVSVVVCVYTLDRWDDIREAVQSIRDQTLTAIEILVVVDYNPTLLAAATEAFPDARVIASRQAKGLSGGRNTGIAEAQGSIIAFLDDDAVADRDWLRILVGHCERPEVLGAGSTVEAIWRGVRPAWFPEEFLWTVGCSFRGAPTRMQAVRNVQGGSMVIKRELFDTIGGFTVQLGRQGSKVPISCEETDLCIRAHEAMPNGVFVFDPASIIWHKVPANRLTWRYFALRCYAEGRSKAILEARSKHTGSLDTERSYLTHALVPGFLHHLGRAITRFDGTDMKKAAAIVVGLSSAVVGYVEGRFRSLRGRRSASAPVRDPLLRRDRPATPLSPGDPPEKGPRPGAVGAVAPGLSKT